MKAVSVEYCKANSRLGCFLLAKPLTWWIHFDPSSNRDVPCFNERCLLCPGQRRKKGFCPAWTKPQNLRGMSKDSDPDATGRVLFILELTEHALDCCHGDLRRGVAVLLTRQGPQSPVFAKRMRDDPPEILPRGFDVRPYLMRMWRVAEMPLAIEEMRSGQRIRLAE